MDVGLSLANHYWLRVIAYSLLESLGNPLALSLDLYLIFIQSYNQALTTNKHIWHSF